MKAHFNLKMQYIISRLISIPRSLKLRFRICWLCIWAIFHRACDVNSLLHLKVRTHLDCREADWAFNIFHIKLAFSLQWSLAVPMRIAVLFWQLLLGGILTFFNRWINNQWFWSYVLQLWVEFYACLLECMHSSIIFPLILYKYSHMMFFISLRVAKADMLPFFVIWLY